MAKIVHWLLSMMLLFLIVFFPIILTDTSFTFLNEPRKTYVALFIEFILVFFLILMIIKS